MRIWPSQSTVMKRKVGSTASFDDGQVQPVALGDPGPVVDAGAAQRIDAEAELGAADDLQVDDVVRDRRHTALKKSCRCVVGSAQRPFQRHALHPGEPGLEQARWPCPRSKPVTAVSAGPPFGRVVLEAAVLRRIVRGRDDDPVGQAVRAAAVVGQDRVRDHRGRRVLVSGGDHDLDSVGREHLQRGGAGRNRQGVGVDAQKQRARRSSDLGDRGRSPG